MNVAVVGLGPVALLTSALLQRAGLDFHFRVRGSQRSADIARSLNSPEGLAIRQTFDPMVGGLPPLRGRVFTNPGDAPNADAAILCVPCTELVSASRTVLASGIKEILVMNSGLGCSSDLAFPDVEVSVFSNFFAAAKLSEGQLLWKALKKKVFFGGSGRVASATVQTLRGLGVEVVETRPIDAEFRNITLYAHAAFGLAPHTLERVFGLVAHPRYLYKVYPEGPVERTQTRIYAGFFEDVMQVARRLGASPFNLLEFLHRDNYPVSQRFLTEEEVRTFPSLSIPSQGDLLFARYTGLLVDSNSRPDSRGRYFDFSAVPVECARREGSRMTLPRVPGEDLYHLILLRILGRRLGLQLDWLEILWGGFKEVQRRLQADEVSALEQLVSEQKSRAEKVADSMVGVAV